jgi:predicted nucleic acid-binding protein
MIRFNTSKPVSFSTPQKQEPELFYINRRALRELEANLDYGKTHLQKIIDEFQIVSGTIPTMEEVASWFGTHKNDFLVANESSIEKSVLNYATNVAGEDQTRSDLKELFSASHQLIFIQTVDSKEMICWDVYRIASGDIELIREEAEAIKNTFRIYAITKEEVERLAEVRRLCAIMNSLKLINKAKISVPGIVFFDDESGSFTPHENYIKGYLK